MVKTEDEIARIRRSVQTNSEAFDNVAREFASGHDRVARSRPSLDYQMRKLGAEGTAFETIVASGPRPLSRTRSPTQQTAGRG